jgi:hypothetical protein
MRVFGLFLVFFCSFGLAQVDGYDSGEPPSWQFAPLFGKWMEASLESARAHFPEWREDLKKVFEQKWTGLQLHAAPLSEKALPRRRFHFFRMPPRFLPRFRTSSGHWDALEVIAKESRQSVNYERELRGMEEEKWSKLLWHFDDVLFHRLTLSHSEFAERIASVHSRRYAPSEFEWEQLYFDYLELWAVGALWEMGRNHLIERLKTHGSWSRDTFPGYRDHIEVLGECRVALVRIAASQYLW